MLEPAPRNLSRAMATYNEGEAILFEELANPYNVENMIKAVPSIAGEGIVPSSPFLVRAIHSYVKFSPANRDQWQTLTGDNTHVDYDYPLDREIIQPGNRYHDLAIPDNITL